ncbi:MAG: hypothetical protein KKC76_16195 [Proteobacteria bacterium]|nr:hypothetical protein [Pseudomonadota bacterium]MBU4298112.1 hypothetical protein [Pseudomonadota bacterium]MCG2746559.1 hypothetical protein [Desulfobulbaceae bacterium]
MFAWNQFLRTTTTRSLYLLGAGASAPEISRGAQLSKEVRRLFWENGVFPASAQPTSSLKSAILKESTGFQQDDCFITQRELDDLTPPEFMEVAVAQLLTRKERICPVQYQIFDLFYPSFIFNFNVDNLADCIHWKHEAHYPHLKIEPLIAHAEFMQKALTWLAIPACVAEYFPYWRPVPESPFITSTEPYQARYRRLKDVFSTIRNVCLIGYSFGAWGGGIDDAESFEMLTDLLRWQPKPVLVVNPEPYNLIYLLEGSIKQKVFGLPCKWNILSKFIATGLFHKTYLASAGSIKRFTYSFLRFDEFMSEYNERMLEYDRSDVDTVLRQGFKMYQY